MATVSRVLPAPWSPAPRGQALLGGAASMRKKLGKSSSRPKGPPRMGRAARIPEIKPGRYADGMPYNEVQYLECKIILRPNHFTSRKSFFDFAKVMRRPAEEAGADFSIDGFVDTPLQIREVLFLDTEDFRF